MNGKERKEVLLRTVCCHCVGCVHVEHIPLLFAKLLGDGYININDDMMMKHVCQCHKNQGDNYWKQTD